MSKDSKIYIIGGGIAGLSAAVYLLNDGEVEGKNIKIFNESKKLGGSLDAQNLEESEGYVMRGIRMFEEESFACTFDLMSKIPSLDIPGETVRGEFIAFNKVNKSYSKSRLLRNGEAIDARPLNLSFGDRLRVITLLFRRESFLENMEIKEYFSDSFFISNFWYEFCTVFAFQPWHSLIEFRRYFVRFMTSFPKIDTLETIEISPYNQYEFMILPILSFLRKRGVKFVTGTRIDNLNFKSEGGKKFVSRIYFNKDEEIVVDRDDKVFITLGSIVSNSAIGSMNSAPVLNLKERDAAWMLWENIIKDNPEFGKPSVFNNHIDKSRWTSFTVTFRDKTFIELMDKFVHKKVTSFGGVNLIDSNWLLSVVLTYTPYFLNQPKNVSLCWGYALRSEEKGNFINKKMSECTGEEILTEVIHHLGFEKHLDKILKSAICIPCTTPYITSLFLPRAIEDRPLAIPESSINFAFLGQYCEIPKDTVFTVEYSIRSAQIAVYKLLGLKKKNTPIYQGTHHIKVLYNALKTVFR